MKSRPDVKISIVTVVFNAEKFIENCVKSVIRQTYKNIEYIVIDGGSTDNTLILLKKYQSYFAHFISEPDNGISDAFNKGIRLATGSLIALLNADDYYSDNAVELVVEKYLELNRPLKTIFHGDISITYAHKTKIYKPANINRFKFELPVWHPSTFFTSDVYCNYEYNLNFKIAMDYEILSRVYKNNYNFIYIPAIINNMHGGGVSNTLAIKGFKEVKKASKSNLNINPVKAEFYFIYRVLLFKLMQLKRTVLK